MPFFEPLPELPEAPGDGGPIAFDFPWQRPDHWLPGLGDSGVVLARTPTTAVFLTVDAVYPRGISLDLQARIHPDHLAQDGLFWQHDPGRSPGSALRFGLGWPDGSRVVADEGCSPEARTAEPSLSMAGGGGGGLTWSWRMWLTPLPPPGPVTVHVLWESRGIPETAVEWDLSAIVARAGAAAELWPLPPPPAEHGWMAYAPMRGASYASHAPDETDDEGER